MDEDLKLLVVISKAYKAIVSNLEKDIRTYRINPTEFAVMELLHSKGKQPLQAIGSKILLTSGSITYVVDKLVCKGFVERQRCDEDRRVIYAKLTQEGVAFIANIFPSHAHAVKNLFAHLDAHQKALLTALLKETGLRAQL